MISNKVHIPDLELKNSDEKEILTLFAKIQDAMINKNISKLREYNTTNSTLQHISGKIQTKEEFYKEIEDGVLNYYESSLDKNYKIEIKEDIGVLTGICTLKAKVYGSSGVWSLDMWKTFKKINNVWFADDEKYF